MFDRNLKIEYIEYNGFNMNDIIILLKNNIINCTGDHK